MESMAQSKMTSQNSGYVPDATPNLNYLPTTHAHRYEDGNGMVIEAADDEGNAPKRFQRGDEETKDMTNESAPILRRQSSRVRLYALQDTQMDLLNINQCSSVIEGNATCLDKSLKKNDDNDDKDDNNTDDDDDHNNDNDGLSLGDANSSNVVVAASPGTRIETSTEKHQQTSSNDGCDVTVTSSKEVERQVNVAFIPAENADDDDDDDETMDKTIRDDDEENVNDKEKKEDDADEEETEAGKQDDGNNGGLAKYNTVTTAADRPNKTKSESRNNNHLPSSSETPSDNSSSSSSSDAMETAPSSAPALNAHSVSDVIGTGTSPPPPPPPVTTAAPVSNGNKGGSKTKKEGGGIGAGSNSESTSSYAKKKTYEQLNPVEVRVLKSTLGEVVAMSNGGSPNFDDDDDNDYDNDDGDDDGDDYYDVTGDNSPGSGSSSSSGVPSRRKKKKRSTKHSNKTTHTGDDSGSSSAYDNSATADKEDGGRACDITGAEFDFASVVPMCKGTNMSLKDRTSHDAQLLLEQILKGNRDPCLGPDGISGVAVGVRITEVASPHEGVGSNKGKGPVVKEIGCDEDADVSGNRGVVEVEVDEQQEQEEEEVGKNVSLHNAVGMGDGDEGGVMTSDLVMEGVMTSGGHLHGDPASFRENVVGSGTGRMEGGGANGGVVVVSACSVGGDDSGGGGGEKGGVTCLQSQQRNAVSIVAKDKVVNGTRGDGGGGDGVLMGGAKEGGGSSGVVGSDDLNGDDNDGGDKTDDGGSGCGGGGDDDDRHDDDDDDADDDDGDDDGDGYNNAFCRGGMNNGEISVTAMSGNERKNADGSGVGENVDNTFRASHSVEDDDKKGGWDEQSTEGRISVPSASLELDGKRHLAVDNSDVGPTADPSERRDTAVLQSVRGNGEKSGIRDPSMNSGGGVTKDETEGASRGDVGKDSSETALEVSETKTNTLNNDTDTATAADSSSRGKSWFSDCDLDVVSDEQWSWFESCNVVYNKNKENDDDDNDDDRNHRIDDGSESKYSDDDDDEPESDSCSGGQRNTSQTDEERNNEKAASTKIAVNVQEKDEDNDNGFTSKMMEQQLLRNGKNPLPSVVTIKQSNMEYSSPPPASQSSVQHQNNYKGQEVGSGVGKNAPRATTQSPSGGEHCVNARIEGKDEEGDGGGGRYVFQSSASTGMICPCNSEVYTCEGAQCARHNNSSVGGGCGSSHVTRLNGIREILRATEMFFERGDDNGDHNAYRRETDGRTQHHHHHQQQRQKQQGVAATATANGGRRGSGRASPYSSSPSRASHPNRQHQYKTKQHQPPPSCPIANIPKQPKPPSSSSKQQQHQQEQQQEQQHPKLKQVSSRKNSPVPGTNARKWAMEKSKPVLQDISHKTDTIPSKPFSRDGCGSNSPRPGVHSPGTSARPKPQSVWKHSTVPVKKLENRRSDHNSRPRSRTSKKKPSDSGPSFPGQYLPRPAPTPMLSSSQQRDEKSSNPNPSVKMPPMATDLNASTDQTTPRQDGESERVTARTAPVTTDNNSSYTNDYDNYIAKSKVDPPTSAPLSPAGKSTLSKLTTCTNQQQQQTTLTTKTLLAPLPNQGPPPPSSSTLPVGRSARDVNANKASLISRYTEILNSYDVKPSAMAMGAGGGGGGVADSCSATTSASTMVSFVRDAGEEDASFYSGVGASHQHGEDESISYSRSGDTRKKGDNSGGVSGLVARRRLMGNDAASWKTHMGGRGVYIPVLQRPKLASSTLYKPKRHLNPKNASAEEYHRYKMDLRLSQSLAKIKRGPPTVDCYLDPRLHSKSILNERSRSRSQKRFPEVMH